MLLVPMQPANTAMFIMNHYYYFTSWISIEVSVTFNKMVEVNLVWSCLVLWR